MTELLVWGLIVMNVLLFGFLVIAYMTLNGLNRAISNLLRIASTQEAMWKSQTKFNNTAKYIIADLQKEVIDRTTL